MEKYALDTNILLYAKEEAMTENGEIALKLIASGANLSQLAYQEFLFKLKSQYGYAKNDISRIGINLLEIINLNSISKDTYRYANYLLAKHNFQLNDSIIIADAILNACNILYSQDKMGHHGMIEKKLKVINPFL